METFTLPDPYEGWTEEQLKKRIRTLASAVMEWELIAANMGVAPGALSQLCPVSRQKVERVMEAYSD